MESNSNTYSRYFLPSYFKIIGLVLVLISILVLVFAALVRTCLYIFPAAHQVLLFNRLSFVCGLSLVIFSKEKNENKETDEARFKAFIVSLAASIVLLIIFEIINTLNSNLPIYAVDFIIIQMCIYYIFFRIKNVDQAKALD